MLTMLKSKIHRAVVTEASLHYVGSITIDEDLLEASNIYEYEKVQIVNVDNGNRFETYVIKGTRGSGTICLNGAAARLVHEGDRVIIMSYCLMEEKEAKNHVPKVVLVNDDNSFKKISLEKEFLFEE